MAPNPEPLKELAHELNNQLLVIDGNAELAQSGPSGVEDELAEIRRAAERARALVRRLSALSAG